jgi:integrase
VPEIKNKAYLKFLNTGLIDVLGKKDFEELLEEIEYKYYRQARALMIFLYYSGRRPSEILELTSGAFKKERRYLKVTISTKKGGSGGIMFLSMNDHIKELWNYVRDMPPNMFVFWDFRARSKKRTGYVDTSYKVRYWVKKWSKKIGRELVPYFFRHNRLSELAMKGASPEELMFWKGAKTLDSVAPYLHVSPRKAKKLARMLR